MDAAEISRRMARRALEVCQHLLPKGTAISGEYHVASVEGEKGSGPRGSGSCRIHIRDDGKAGVWSDFGGEKGGDLITLWMKVRGVDFVTAIQEIQSHFRWEAPEQHSATKERKEYKRPTWSELQAKQVKGIVPKHDRAEPPPPPPGIEEQSPVLACLMGKRKLSWETLSLLRIAEKPPGERGPRDNRIKHGWTICYPYFRDNSQEPPLNVKYVELERSASGGKITWQEWNAEPCLFGWQAITNDDTYVVLSEGEPDAATWIEWGHPSLSIPNGAGGGQKQLAWIENEYDRLERFMRIYICFDRDRRPAADDPDPLAMQKWEKKVAAVNEAIQIIAQRLGHHRCLLVSLPGDIKDPNEGLQKGMTSKDAQRCLNQARWLDPEELRPAGDFADDVAERFRIHRGMEQGQEEVGQKLSGYRPAWAAAVKAKVLVELGKVLIVHGLSHHGKSEFVRFSEIYAAFQGFRVCKASLEEPPGEQLWKQYQQIGGAWDIDELHQKDIEGWMRGKFWLYKMVGAISLTKLLDLMSYAVKRHGCNWLTIDSLMMLEPEESGKSKWDKQFDPWGDMVKRMVTFAREHGVIVCLVCHDTDPEKDADGVELPPKKSDIRGIKTIGDMVHDIWMVYRDDRLKLGGKGSKRTDNPTKGKTLLMVQKGKTYGQMPIVPFTFDPSRQFLLDGQKTAPFISPRIPQGQQPMIFTQPAAEPVTAPEAGEGSPCEDGRAGDVEEVPVQTGLVPAEIYGKGYSYDPDRRESLADDR